jgi:hypothetical protein
MLGGVTRLQRFALGLFLLLPGTAEAWSGHGGGHGWGGSTHASSAAHSHTATHTWHDGSSSSSHQASHTAHSHVQRDPRQRAAFQHGHPCPSTHKTSGGCPGYVVDHVVPLKRGGTDAPANMQWQTVQAGKAKDKVE